MYHVRTISEELWRVCDETVELYMKMNLGMRARAKHANIKYKEICMQSVSGKPVITLVVMM